MPSGYAVAIVIGVYPFLISWFFNRCILLWEKKELGRLEDAVQTWLKSKRPPPHGAPEISLGSKARDIATWLAFVVLDVDVGQGIAPPSPRKIRGPATTQDLKRVHGLSLRRVVAEMAAWLIAVLLVTLAFGAWPLLRHGDAFLRVLGLRWISLEQGIESGQILLCGGAITLLSGLLALAWVPIAWRPVEQRLRALFEQAAPFLKRAEQ